MKIPQKGQISTLLKNILVVINHLNLEDISNNQNIIRNISNDKVL